MNSELTCLIADDNELQRDYTLSLLNAMPDVKCIAECSSALEVRTQLQSLHPDFLILDVEMPELTGIELVRSMKQAPLVIFITSHPSYAVDAFEVEAVDYLMKPVAVHRLLRAVDKVRNIIAQQVADNQDDGYKKDNDEYFFIKEKSLYTRIAYQDVQYIEALGNFSSFCLSDGKKKVALVSLSGLESQLSPSKFIRVSRMFIANRDHITAVGQDLVYIRETELPLGRAYAEAVLTSIVGNHAIRRLTR